MGKKSLATIAGLVMVLILCAQGTWAFHTAVGTSTNVITSGELELTIREKPANFNPVGILPGDVVSKAVTVENTCGHPFYLRVKLVFGANSQELFPEECLKVHIDTENWIPKDDWCYYAGILQPGEQTPVVFSQLEILGDKVDASYIGKPLTLSVVAQAVQSENNPPALPGDFTTVSGWPEGQE